MSTSAPGRAPTQATPRGEVYGSERGSGWIAFAGTMLLILGGKCAGDGRRRDLRITRLG